MAPNTPLPERICEATIKVRYAETDQMGIAYYANYLIWFEVGRSQYCADAGFSYRQLETDEGLFLIVAEANCKYRNPARYDDTLVVRTSITDLSRRTVRFAYEIVGPRGEQIATGETLHVLINKNGRPSSFPDRYMALLRDGRA